MSDIKSIPIHILEDKKLSLKAKGLLAILLTFSEYEDFDLNFLHKFSKEGEKATKSVFKELKSLGYVEMTPNKTINGRFSKSTLKFNLEENIVDF